MSDYERGELLFKELSQARAEIRKLEAENVKLKEEVERLKAERQ
jgi:hypothetical protein